jgi:pyruvate dehydrogenase (quinone)
LTADQVEPLLAQALKHDGPALIEIPVSRQELSMPPTITYEQARGFSLFMMRAVLNGRGNEIIDVATVNKRPLHSATSEEQSVHGPEC